MPRPPPLPSWMPQRVLSTRSGCFPVFRSAAWARERSSLMTDGTVSRAAIANNWNRPLANSPGCFAALWTRTETRTSARVLALDSPYHLPTVAKLDYDGLFPQAILTYPDPALPVQTTLTAFSPFVPFDVKNSSFPAAAYVLRLKNPAPTPVEVSVALSWENMLPAREGDARANVGTNGSAAIIPSGGGFFGAQFTRDAKAADGGAMALLAYPQRAQAVVTTALWSADAERPGWWDAFARDGAVAETQGNSDPVAKPDAAGGISSQAFPRPAAVVAVRLTLKPGEYVELPFAVSWYVPHLKTPAGEDVGHYYEIAFQNENDAARQLLEDWRSLYGLTEEWQKRLTFSNLPRWSSRRLINAAAPLAANTIHTRDNRFAFLGTVGTGGTASADGSTALLNPLETEREETRAHECADALLLTLFPQLAAQELAQFAATQDSKGFVVPPASGDWAARLGPPSPVSGPFIPNTDSLFASLQSGNGTASPPPADSKKTAGDKSSVAGRAGANSSSPPGTKRTPSKTKPVPPTPAVPAPFVPPPSPALDVLDATCAYVLQTTQFALWTGDPDFVKQNYPNVRRALQALRSLPGLNGQKPEEALRYKKQSLSAEFRTLWLATLRAGQKMARLAGDDALARECKSAFQQGSAQLEAQHWNGQFYTESPLSTKPGEKPANAPAPDAICATDQLWGQWLAYQLDLGPLLPTEHLLKTAQSVQQRNDQAAAATPSLLPVWRIRADGKRDDPANNINPAECLLPASLLADAAVNVWQDQPEVGVTLLRRLEDGRNLAARSPWQYPARIDYRAAGKRGDTEKSQGTGEKREGETRQNVSSLAVTADWNLLYALQGFALDVPSGQMTLAPNIPGTWRAFNAPVYAPTFWGRMEYRPTVHGGLTTFRLDRLIGFVTTPANSVLRSRAELTLKTLRVLGPPRHQDNTLPMQFTAHVSLGQKPIGCRSTLDAAGFVTLAFDSPLMLTAGDRLEVDIH